MDNEAEGYVPEYAETIKRLQSAARSQVLPMPGLDDGDIDPQNLLAEGVLDRAEANEAAEKKRKVTSTIESFLLFKCSIRYTFSSVLQAEYLGDNFAADDAPEAVPQ